MLKYGLVFDQEASAVDCELAAFRLADEIADRGGLGKEAHFKNAVSLLWPDYVWLEWNERMLWAACNYKYVGITGPASSLKSEFFALWGLVNWMVAPGDTLILLTSTSVSGARHRIFGALCERYNGHAYAQYKNGHLPGKLNTTESIIRFNTGSLATKKFSDRSSITLIAPDPGKEGAAISKLIGLKNKRVIVIADELTDMSPAVVNACANLSKNPEFQFIGIGNANSIMDPHGRFCTPKNGWSSISVDDESWETAPVGFPSITQTGICLHLDGEKTPNMTSDPPDKYPFLITAGQMAIDAGENGKNRGSAAYWRFNRGFWCPSGVSSEHIFNEIEIVTHRCHVPAVWQDDYIELATLDPAYKSGGNRYMATFGRLGLNADHIRVLDFTEQIALVEDITKVDRSTTSQIAGQFVDLCKARGIPMRHTGIDATGGGAPIADTICDLAESRDILRIDSAEKPDESLMIPDQHNTPSREKCKNNATEMWWVGPFFVRSGQLNNIGSELMAELCNRKFSTRAGGVILIEPKTEMKLRTQGKSPDRADSALLMLRLARQRFGFVTSGNKRMVREKSQWGRIARKLDVATQSGRQLKSLA